MNILEFPLYISIGNMLYGRVKILGIAAWFYQLAKTEHLNTQSCKQVLKSNVHYKLILPEKYCYVTVMAQRNKLRTQIQCILYNSQISYDSDFMQKTRQIEPGCFLCCS